MIDGVSFLIAVGVTLIACIVTWGITTEITTDSEWARHRTWCSCKRCAEWRKQNEGGKTD
jgi:hypothetical protein